MTRRKRRSKKPPVVLHEPNAEEIALRAQSPLTGIVCWTCGWIYIQGGGSGRRTCTKCRAETVRRYDADSLGVLADTLIQAEMGHPDPIGNEVFIRRRFAEAFERFNQRKDAWATANVIATRIAGGEPPRALISKVYRDWQSKSPAERERRARKRAEASSKAQAKKAPGAARPGGKRHRRGKKKRKPGQVRLNYPTSDLSKHASLDELVEGLRSSGFTVEVEHSLSGYQVVCDDVVVASSTMRIHLRRELRTWMAARDLPTP